MPLVIQDGRNKRKADASAAVAAGNEPAAKRLKFSQEQATYLIVPSLTEKGALDCGLDMLRYFMQASILILPPCIVEIAYQYAAYYLDPSDTESVKLVMESTVYQKKKRDGGHDHDDDYDDNAGDDTYADGFRLEPEHFVASIEESAFPVHISFWKHSIRREYAAIYDTWIGYVRSVVCVHDIHGSQIPAIAYGAFSNEYSLFCNQFRDLMTREQESSIQDAIARYGRGECQVHIPDYAAHNTPPTGEYIWLVQDFYTGFKMNFDALDEPDE